MDKYGRKVQHKTRRSRLGLLYAALSFIAVYAGLVGGRALNASDIKLIKTVNTDKYRSVLNYTLPIINFVYNSGSGSVSLSGTVKDAVKWVFGFEVENPVTIMNTHSSLFSAYYNDLHLAGNDTGPQDIKARYDDTNLYDKQDEITGQAGTGDERADLSRGGESLPENSSSISIEVEEKDLPESSAPPADDKITIQNETKYVVNVEELLKQPLKLNFDKKTSKVLVFHTHTTESYIKNITQLNMPNILTRTTDPRYSVVRVGQELAQNLKSKYGFQVIHNGTIHDYPDYNRSYVNSLETVNEIIKGNPTTKIVLDIHRDAIGSDSKLRRVTKVNGKDTARMMFVVATGEVGLDHPNWKENLKLAVKLQAKLNKISPEITCPIYLSKYRYNQHVTPGALLVEMGGDGNLLEEALESTKYLAQALNEVINEQ